MTAARHEYSYQQPQRHVSTQSSAGSFFRFFKLFFLLLTSIILVGTAGILITWWTLPQGWLPKYDQNIVFVSDNLDLNSNLIYIVNYRQKTREIYIQPILAEGEVQVPGGYGKYPLKSVLPLARIEKKSDPEIRALYSYVLETPVDQVWSTAKAETLLFKKPRDLAGAFLVQDIHGQMGWKERLAWAWLLRRQVAELPEAIDLSTWQKKAQMQRDPAVFRDCRVGIVNTTKTVGLAGRAERVLSQAGATVLRVTDQDTSVSASKILYQPNNQACLELLRYLPGLFPQIVEITADETVFQRGRSELEIVLGEDIAKFLER